MKLSIQQAVKKFYANKSLSEAQLQSLQNQQADARLAHKNSTKNYLTLTWLASVAASFLLLAVVFTQLHTPAVINAAYADIKTDATISNGLQLNASQWLSENLINAVPEIFPVEMSKFCTLENDKTTHLRIAGTEQGKLHLFFYHGKHPAYWLNRSGTTGEMNWKLIEVRDGLTVVALYTVNMRESSVRQILDKMLPVLNA